MRQGRARIVAVLLGAVLLCVLLRNTVRSLLGVVLPAVAFAFLLKPLCAHLEKRMPQSFAALSCILLVLLSIAALLYSFIPSFIEQYSSIETALSDVLRELRGLYANIVRYAAQYGITVAENPLPLEAHDLFSTIAVAGNVADVLYRAALSVTLTFFFLLDRERLLLRVEWLIPFAWRKRVVCMGNAVAREMYLYLRGQALICLSVGALAALGLWMIRVPSAPALGLAVGIFNLIPYFGPVLGGIPAVVMALQGGTAQALMAIVVLFVVQQADNIMISPRIMGSLTGISPASVLLAVFAGSTLSGIVGMLLALPLFMAMRTLFRVFVQKEENI